MPDLILHHYANSPFAEKIRLVMGHKKLAWKSVLTPNILPKPNLVALTGGYRRAPVLQIGADIYCDTALICDVLEHRAPEPTLYPKTQKGLSRVLAQWADGTVFWAAMGYNFSPRGAAAMFKVAPAGTAEAFAKDRGAMRGGMPRMPAADAAAAYRSYLRRIADALDHSAFLLGDAPCIADFATYHPLWFSRVCIPEMADIFEPVSQVLAWMDRIASIGHGTVDKSFDAAAAIALAKQSTPEPIAADAFFQDEHGIPLGSQVTITAESFGLEPTQGELLAATRMHYTLRRNDERAGTVHVHFPRIGYILKKQGD